jgi:hypothetical protein
VNAHQAQHRAITPCSGRLRQRLLRVVQAAGFEARAARRRGALKDPHDSRCVARPSDFPHKIVVSQRIMGPEDQLNRMSEPEVAPRPEVPARGLRVAGKRQVVVPPVNVDSVSQGDAPRAQSGKAGKRQWTQHGRKGFVHSPRQTGRRPRGVSSQRADFA